MAFLREFPFDFWTWDHELKHWYWASVCKIPVDFLTLDYKLERFYWASVLEISFDFWTLDTILNILLGVCSLNSFWFLDVGHELECFTGTPFVKFILISERRITNLWIFTDVRLWNSFWLLDVRSRTWTFLVVARSWNSFLFAERAITNLSILLGVRLCTAFWFLGVGSQILASLFDFCLWNLLWLLNLIREVFLVCFFCSFTQQIYFIICFWWVKCEIWMLILRLIGWKAKTYRVIFFYYL